MADHALPDPDSMEPNDRSGDVPEAIASDMSTSDNVAGLAEGERERSTGDVSAKRRRTGGLAASIFVLAIGASVNWPYQYIEVNRGAIGDVNSEVDFPARRNELPVMAGWPYRYMVSYSRPAAADASVLQWSTTALLYNVLLLIGAMFAVVLYAYHKSRLAVGAGRAANRRITIADLLLLTVLLAIPFALWQRLQSRSDSELALTAQISRVGGRSSMAAWAPRIVANHLPTTLANRLRRVRAVRVEHPSTKLVEQLVGQHEIAVLRIGGGDYDLRLLERLAGNPHLHDLRISGRAIDGRAVQWIGSNRQLDTLNLMRTNVSAEALASLDSLPRLQRLSLVHSDVRLSELGNPPWSATLREIALPHPGPGDTARVEIKGWPHLAKLSINDMESQTNGAAMKVTLADLPALTTLELDLFQKFDLTLRNLPLLKEVTTLDYAWMSRIPRGGVAPGQLWLSRLDAEGLPELENLRLFGVDLEYFRVQQSPKFKFVGLGAFYKTISASTYARKLSPQAASSAIEGIGNSDGPTLVDLDAVPLKGVDLAPLAENRRLEGIMLSQSGTSLEQWKGLAPMKWLKRLDLKGCSISIAFASI